ncbi:DUF6445 family protein [Sutcliffiella horikoshii]|uniref:DUF6445 family protein n=1 Tax=Sutcliffiella horikoshii TaxID=79883 RepID=UPI003CE984E8
MEDKTSLFVVDNFYNSPDKIRDFAINTNDYIKNGYNYETSKLYYNESIKGYFEKIIGEEIIVDPSRMGFGSLTYFTEGDEMHNYTHYDGAKWVALIYLVPNEFIGGGGLHICRHKNTGLTGPPNSEWLENNNFKSLDEWKEKVYSIDQTNSRAWETTMFISMKYNRLIIKKAGEMFHRGTKGFGTNPGNSKLIHRFFFDTRSGGQL